MIITKAGNKILMYLGIIPFLHIEF
jgi:hypothetical protein